TTTGKVGVLIVGREGVGKSSLGNLLCERKCFPVGTVLSSGNKDCSCYTVTRDNLAYLVVDTPGVCEWETGTQETKETTMKVYHELVMGGMFTAPGPHVILVVFKCGRFLRAEYEYYLALKKLFGAEMCTHMIVVFTGVDSLNTPDKPAPDLASQRAALEEELGDAPRDSLRIVLDDAGNRYIGVNNNARGAERDTQSRELIELIKSLYEDNEHSHYISDFFQEIFVKIDNETERRMEQNACQPRKILRMCDCVCF
ncbi:hypothetical protein BaRGS_00030732, partial [Batillaria attramentaria]